MFSTPDENEIELTQEDISELIVYGEVELEHRLYGKIKIKLLFHWS